MLLYYLFLYLFVLYVLAFICTVVLSCCHLSVIFNIDINARRLASHKTWFVPPFFFNFSNFLYQTVLSYSSFLCVLQCHLVFGEFQCFCCFVVFPSLFVCYPDLFALKRCMTFEQRYTTVALMYTFKQNLSQREVMYLIQKKSHDGK